MRKSNKPNNADKTPHTTTHSSSRVQKLAATVAALGATIGVNMSDVLAGSKGMHTSDIDKAAISSQKLKRPSVRTPKVESPTLKIRPNVRTPKVETPGLQNRPEVKTPKVEQPNLQNRPSVQADKVSPILSPRPDTKSGKF